ncbi:helix-turn-helix domain-containing protein [Acaryochloris marina]|uniref:HTH cro/C1-type domain-containing protein n=1 Tax=Acaryochloris marina (strain MBIC 11017) TaxID=329726 RepID=A8ZQV1_ACAM1|nr:helix-turn-helix transcriptional regulator [Acaryochloris marina]ABW33387.1 hypothetical protein AM1_H0037 [Acaryochloris marina MBIC11017]
MIKVVIPETMPMINTVKEFLDSRGITPYALGGDAGISKTTAYALYKNPDQLPSPDVLRKICDTYEIQPGLLMKWEKDTRKS